MINVLHFSRTPLAGSPIRICKALNKYTSVKSSLVVYDPSAYGSRSFEQDLIWNEHREQVIELARNADIIHLHNEIDLDSTIFLPINFRQLMKQGKKIIRQFHSVPSYVSRRSSLAGSPPKSETDLLNCPLPKLVLSQYHERYYPTARVVPNIVPISDADILAKQIRETARIFFAPTSILSAWDGRWDVRWGTKGSPETMRMLKRIAKRYNKKSNSYPRVILEIHSNIPHSKCMEIKRISHISIDELVTGSYHLSSLESLAMGHPTLCYLDNRIQKVLFELTGSSELPWVNVRLEEAEEVLIPLIEDVDLRNAIGKNSFHWMKTYWKDRDMVQHFVRAYQDLLEQPEVFKTVRFDINDKKVMWFVQGLDDAIWEARKKQHCSIIKQSYIHLSTFLMENVFSKFSILRKLKNCFSVFRRI